MPGMDLTPAGRFVVGRTTIDRGINTRSIFTAPAPPAAPAPPPLPTPPIASLPFSGEFPASPGAVTDYGSDISVVPDLDETFRLISGRRVLAEALLRRMTTDPGTLDFWQTYGFDVRGFLRENVTQATLFEAKQGLSAALEQDERVYACDVGVQYFDASESLEFTLAVDAAPGPFELVISVTDAGLKLLTYQEG